MSYQALAQEAEQILRLNWRDGFTVPTNKLYPFQWNWDSGFTCLGHAYFEPKWAIRELNSLLSGQWENGMIPHIIFHSETETSYFPNHDFWNTTVNAGAPQKPKTSGITQPPVHGFILENLLSKFPDDAALLAFVKAIFPKVVHSHRFFYTYRDPEREGLAFLYHPWETGRDNSPLWDESNARIQIDKSTLPAYTRQDTKLADKKERPTSDQYDRFVYMLELGKKHQYDGEGIFEESPVLLQDTLTNAILIQSNQSLIRIGERLGLDTGELKEWQAQSVKSFREKLWNEKLATFTCYDLRKEAQIEYKEIGGLTALSAEIATKDQANKLNDYLNDLHNRGYYLCPSFDVDDPLFDSKRYWRGPIWPQMNWLIYGGLKAYGFMDTAKIVRGDFLELVDKLGFYEYFEAQKSVAVQLDKGYGGGQFSWTSACVLDLLHEDG
ncbi:MGH1-like glycoside hydrolase domain-containing protein [Lewinella cohaerens]|uniref:MGH1-like glycoside hydrolase domain-containing protein n=1 Tax=Lewinella cohaerens TaxID=70995 RepID=UPI00036AB03A|nr:trehalase family glycosidase [Lewinella cohaerens]